MFQKESGKFNLKSYSTYVKNILIYIIYLSIPINTQIIKIIIKGYVYVQVKYPKYL